MDKEMQKLHFVNNNKKIPTLKKRTCQNTAAMGTSSSECKELSYQIFPS